MFELGCIRGEQTGVGRADRLARATVVLLPLMLSPAFAFDGTPTTDEAARPLTVTAPATAPAPKITAPASASSSSALDALQYAAEGGHPVAQYKLGRMYATGEGVAKDSLRAFDYFSKIANSHAEDNPAAPQAAIVANAFVKLGQYYLDGIPNSPVKADPERAREMFSYAASYFGDANAQYKLALLYLAGKGVQRDAKYAARWLVLAAQKGQYQAQAMLGRMLIDGDQVPRQTARGLMWLTLAQDAASADETWIKDSYASAIKKASEDDRAMALMMLEQHLKTRRN